MKSKHVTLYGLIGTWYMIDSYADAYGNKYYLWESDILGEYAPAVLTDENLTVIDDRCESGIVVAIEEYFNRIKKIENVLCELTGEQVYILVTQYHGSQVVEEVFYELLVDEGFLPEDEEDEDEDKGVENV